MINASLPSVLTGVFELLISSYRKQIVSVIMCHVVFWDAFEMS